MNQAHFEHNDIELRDIGWDLRLVRVFMAASASETQRDREARLAKLVGTAGANCQAKGKPDTEPLRGVY